MDRLPTSRADCLRACWAPGGFLVAVPGVRELVPREGIEPPALLGLLGYGQLDTTIGSGLGIVLRMVLLAGLEPAPSPPSQGGAFAI